jgi:hypothetical protein
VLSLAGAAWLAGCAVSTQRFGRRSTRAAIREHRGRHLDQGDVLREFGPPSAYSALPVVPRGRTRRSTGADDLLARAEAESRMFVYEYREDRENFLTIILLTRFRARWSRTADGVLRRDATSSRYVAFSKQTEEPVAQ